MSTTYKSVNGYTVYRSDEPVQIDPKITELLVDPISLDFYIKPVYLSKSNMIYDMSTIRNWLAHSNKDPLTGIIIKSNKIRVRPVLPYFLTLLCLEQVDDKIMYFHPPVGNIFDMLEIANCIFKEYTVLNEVTNGHFSNSKQLVRTKDGKVWSYKLTNKLSQNTVSLNLNDYFDEIQLVEEVKDQTKTQIKIQETLIHVVKRDDLDVNFHNNCIVKKITLEEMLGICPVTRRSFLNKCRITKEGFFIHTVIQSVPNFCVAGTVSHHIKTGFKHKDKVKMSQWIDYLKINNSEEKECTVSYTFGNLNSKVDYDKIKDESVVNPTRTVYPSLEKYGLRRIFKHPTYNLEHYVTVTSRKQNIYQFYLNNKDTVNKDAVNILSKMCNSTELLKYGTEFVEQREALGLPSILKSEDRTYGNDFSFLKIEDIAIENANLKEVYFVGTQFKNVIFAKTRLSDCNFTGATLTNVKFIDCDEDNCSFYKSKSK